MTCVVGNQLVLLRTPEGPLAPYISSFGEFLSSQGYALSSIHRQVLLAACFSRWLKLKGVEPHSINADHPKRYLRYRARQVKLRPGDAAALRFLIDFLRSEGLIPAETVSEPRLTPVEHYAQAYAQHLREAQALAEATIVNYVPFVHSFLKGRFGDGLVALSELSARDVVTFVQRQAPRLHPKRAKLMTSALRSFLNYARYRGEVILDLAAAVPVVANWSMPSIPRAISADNVQELLISIDQRDYAASASSEMTAIYPRNASRLPTRHNPGRGITRRKGHCAIGSSRGASAMVPVPHKAHAPSS